MEKELLSIVKTFKECLSMLYGNEIHVNADHCNLTYAYLYLQHVIGGTSSSSLSLHCMTAQHLRRCAILHSTSHRKESTIDQLTMEQIRKAFFA